MLPSSPPGALSAGTPRTDIRAPKALWQFCIHFLRTRRRGYARHGVKLPQALLQLARALPERRITVEKGDEGRDRQQRLRVDRHRQARGRATRGVEADFQNGGSRRQRQKLHFLAELGAGLEDFLGRLDDRGGALLER